MSSDTTKKDGPFHRRAPDKRFVKHVTALQHVPPSWTPMDLMENECKIMEIKKFSGEYFEIEK